MTPLENFEYLHQKANSLQEWHINSINAIAWVSIKTALESIPALQAERDALAAKVEELEAFSAGCVFAGGELRGRVDALSATCKVLADALMALIDWQGVDHSDETCPEDDTCTCPIVAKVNAALTTYHATMKG